MRSEHTLVTRTKSPSYMFSVNSVNDSVNGEKHV